MKKFTLFLLLIFTLTASSFAQPQDVPKNANRAKKAKKHVKKTAYETPNRPMQVPESGVKDGTVLDIPPPKVSPDTNSNRKSKKGSKKRTRRT